MKPFDYTTDHSKPGVTMIVRPNNRYGDAYAGQLVLVDQSELMNSSTRSSLMTQEEARQLEEKIAEERAKVEAAAGKKGIVTAMVEEGLARIAGQQKVADTAAQRAESEAVEASVVEHSEEAAAIVGELSDPLPKRRGKKRGA